MLLECFVYTNGRSTYEHCMQYLRRSIGNVSNTHPESPKKVRIFQDKKLVDAMNHTLDICQGTHFIKVDDDFVLHPAAIFHILRCLRSLANSNIAVYDWHLWEVWTNRIVSGVKVYSVEALKSIGGFTEDKYAKLDKITHNRLRKAGFELQKDSSIIGLHTCGTWEEQKKYEKLWSNAAEFKYKKSTHEEQKQYNVPIEEQVKFIDTGFLEYLNQKYRTSFFNWAKRKNKTKQKTKRKNKFKVKNVTKTQKKAAAKVLAENAKRLEEALKWKNVRKVKKSNTTTQRMH